MHLLNVILLCLKPTVSTSILEAEEIWSFSSHRVRRVPQSIDRISKGKIGFCYWEFMPFARNLTGLETTMFRSAYISKILANFIEWICEEQRNRIFCCNKNPFHSLRAQLGSHVHKLFANICLCDSNYFVWEPVCSPLSYKINSKTCFLFIQICAVDIASQYIK